MYVQYVQWCKKKDPQDENNFNNPKLLYFTQTMDKNLKIYFIFILRQVIHKNIKSL